MIAIAAGIVVGRSVRIGLNLPVMAPGLDRMLLERWCRAIDDGPFSTLAVGERINFPNPEIMVTLAAAAVWTRRVRLLANVVVLPMHPEVLVAKQMATLDVLSGGRITVGVGTGGRVEDYAAVGARWDRSRRRRLEQQVARMRAVWRGEVVVPGALRPVEPAPVQPGGPPILIGALDPDTIVRAAAWADGVTGFSFTMDAGELAATFDCARTAWAAAGRRPPHVAAGCWFALGPAARTQMDEYLTRYLNFLGEGGKSMLPLVVTTSVAAIREATARARDAGADELLLVPTTIDPDEVSRIADLLA